MSTDSHERPGRNNLHTPAKLWSQQDASTAAEIWQTHFADYWGDDDGPTGARLRVLQRIAATIGRSCWGVEQRFLSQGPSFGANKSSSSKASAHALAEREARKEAERARDLTAATFGDPPPGYSALDRKNNGARR